MERIARVVVLFLVLAGVVFGGIAVASGGGSPKPGKGCGDRNHVHYKESDCKKPNPGNGNN